MLKHFLPMRKHCGEIRLLKRPNVLISFFAQSRDDQFEADNCSASFCALKLDSIDHASHTVDTNELDYSVRVVTTNDPDVFLMPFSVGMSREDASLLS